MVVEAQWTSVLITCCKTMLLAVMTLPSLSLTIMTVDTNTSRHRCRTCSLCTKLSPLLSSPLLSSLSLSLSLSLSHTHTHTHIYIYIYVSFYETNIKIHRDR